MVNTNNFLHQHMKISRTIVNRASMEDILIIQQCSTSYVDYNLTSNMRDGRRGVSVHEKQGGGIGNWRQYIGIGKTF